MIELYRYTDKEKQMLIDSMVCLVDTREHDGKNQHILDVFDKMGLHYEKRKLNFGDYSMKIPANPDLGIMRDLDFSSKIIIERKANLDEVCGNLGTADRSRIKKELALAPAEKVMLIENATYSDVLHGNYRSKFAPKSLWASLHSFWHEFGLPIFFVQQPEDSAYFIKGYFEYWLKNYLN